jgi:hypothetical protein
VSELSKAARKVAFRSANEALRRDIRHAEVVAALRTLRDATANLLASSGDRAAVDAALATADRALASEPK